MLKIAKKNSHFTSDSPDTVTLQEISFISRFSWIALDVADSPVWTMCSAVVCICVCKCVCVCAQYSLRPAPYDTQPRPSAQSPILLRQRLSSWILSRSWWRCTVFFADSRKVARLAPGRLIDREHSQSQGLVPPPKTQQPIGFVQSTPARIRIFCLRTVSNIISRMWSCKRFMSKWHLLFLYLQCNSTT